MTASTVYVGVGLVGLFLYFHYGSKKPTPNLPPGPKPLPILGNARDFPPLGSVEYQHWLKHKDLYGPISSVSAMGQTIVIVHDRQLATEILDSNSLRSAERPATEMAAMLHRRINMMPNLGYGDDLRYLRKLFHLQMGTQTLARRFQQEQDAECRKFLRRVLDEPDKLFHHIQFMTSSTILKTTYGYTTKTGEPDQLVTLIERFAHGFVDIFTPGTWAVDMFPVIKRLPTWFPGTGFRQTLDSVSRMWNELKDIPYEMARDQMAKGSHIPSFVSRAVEEMADASQSPKLSADPSTGIRSEAAQVDAIKETAAIMHLGAAETTTTSLTVLTLAMIKFPEVQRRAQEEIDRVVGTDRLPGFEDQSELPYIEAVLTEMLRWFPALPMSFPHVTSEDMVLQGYDIPKGSTVLPAVYWFTHDPASHPEPDVFDPERFIAPRSEPDPRQVVFGYGRRVCPGRYFADASLYINVARMLAAFEISKDTDAEGNEIEPVLGTEPGLSVRLTPFPYKLVPRSEKHAELLREVSDVEIQGMS